MKTFRTIIVTMVVTMMVVTVGVGAFLLNEGIVTVSKRDVNHTKTVVIDGYIAESTTWNELMGYEVSINVVDGAYFGK